MNRFNHKSLVVTQKYNTTWEVRRWGRRLVGRVVLDGGNADGRYMVQGPGPRYGQLARYQNLRDALDYLDEAMRPIAM